MSFKLSFKTDNAIFAGDSTGEVSRILKWVSSEILGGNFASNIRDLNGNTIGRFEFDPPVEENPRKKKKIRHYLVKKRAMRRLVSKAAEAVRYPRRKNGETESRELELFINNDADLYRQQYSPIILNLSAKKAKGVYQHDLAVKLFGYLVESGAKKYAKESGNSLPWHKMFSMVDRKAVAESLTKDFEENYDAGEYSIMIGKQKAERKARAQAQAASRHFKNPKQFRCTCGGLISKIGEDEYECEDCGALFERDDWRSDRLKSKNPHVEYKSPLSQHKGPWKCTECGAILKTDAKARSHKLNTGHSSFKSALKNEIPRSACDFCKKERFLSKVEVYSAGAKGVYNLCTPCIDKAKRQGAYEGLYRTKNPPEYKQIGRKCLLIETSKGKCAGNYGGVYGLKDGSVYIKGFFQNVPAGAVCAIEYLDEAKAKREGLKNPSLPWRHDFSKEAVSLRRVRGGLLMKAKNKPLWGSR